MTKSSDEQFADCLPELLAAHDRSSNHRAAVLASVRCGCFCCCANFTPDEILEWTDEDRDQQGQTAVCPRCGIDAVIGDKSGVDVSHDFLVRMREYWFG
jgi:hypothetical protein